MPVPQTTSAEALDRYALGKTIVVGHGPGWEDVRLVVKSLPPTAETFTMPAVTEPFIAWMPGRIPKGRTSAALGWPSYSKRTTGRSGFAAIISWSMAKSITHALVGILVADGRIDPSLPAPVPSWKGTEKERITLQHLLTMSSGLRFVEDYVDDSISHCIDMLFGEGKDDVAAYAAALPLDHEPGSKWSYSSGTTNIICRLLADVVGQGPAFHEFMNRELFDPLGMRSAIPKFDARGTFIGSSYVYATARDFAKFGYLYLRGGEWDGRQLVSREWCESAQIPLSRDEESGTFYSLQWWVTGDAFGSYWANGYEGQSITVVPSLDAVIVRLGATDADRYPALRAWRHDLLSALHQSA